MRATIKASFAFQEVPEERTPTRPEPSNKELEELRQRRLMEQAGNPNYLKPSTKQNTRRSSGALFSSPDTPLEPAAGAAIPGLTSTQKYLRQQQSEKTVPKKSKKGKKDKTESDDDVGGGAKAHQVNRDKGEMPEGVTWSDKDVTDTEDPYKALDIDIVSPLRSDEQLPTYVHRRTVQQEAPEGKPPKTEVSKEESKKKKKVKGKGDEESGKTKKTKSKSHPKESDLGVEIVKKKKKKTKTSDEPNNKTDDVEVSLMNVDQASDSPVVVMSQQEEQVVEQTKDETDDFSFWLAQDGQTAAVSGKKEAERPTSLPVKPVDGRSKELKKKKKSRSKIRARSVEEELVDEAPEIVDKTGQLKTEAFRE